MSDQLSEYQIMELRDLFGDEQRVAAGPNTRSALVSLHEMGLVRLTGAMKLRPPEADETVDLCGASLPLVGSLWDVYEITDAGRAASLRAASDEARG